MSLEYIKNQVISCKKCDLCKTRKNAVPGKGSSNAKIFFIGEAPGRNEDNVGEPFVGSAGKRLSEVLESAGILRSSVYITNIVKCRPPKNRAPNELEKKSCSKYLEKELELIKPKVICVMGNTAYHSLLGGSEITKKSWKIYQKRRLVVFYYNTSSCYNLQSEINSTIRKRYQKIEKLCRF